MHQQEMSFDGHHILYAYGNYLDTFFELGTASGILIILSKYDLEKLRFLGRNLNENLMSYCDYPFVHKCILEESELRKC